MVNFPKSALDAAKDLSVGRFIVLFSTVAVAAADAIGSGVWYVAFRSYGSEVLVPLTITAILVAVPKSGDGAQN